MERARNIWNERFSRRELLKGLGMISVLAAMEGPQSLFKTRKEKASDYFVSAVTFPGEGEPHFYPGLAVAQRLVGLAVENAFYESPGGNILSIWDFGDGNTEERNSAQATHVWEEPGTYDLKVKVLREGGSPLEFRRELELFRLEKHPSFELTAEGNEEAARGRVSKWPIVYLGGKFSLQWWEDFEETRAYFSVNNMIVGGSVASWPKGEWDDYHFENGRILPFSPQNPSSEIYFRLKPPKDGGARCKVEPYFTLSRKPRGGIDLPPVRI